jgi:integrase/recombinase XerD
LVLLKSKRSKDRITAQNFTEMLRNYLIHKPMKYLFEGQIKGQPYDARSLQLILKQALKAGITKPATCIGCDTAYDEPVTLRYSKLLGHSSSKTKFTRKYEKSATN